MKIILAIIALSYAGCSDMIPGAYMYDSMQRQEARKTKKNERDEHGCLKSKCYWRVDSYHSGHCSCEGDWDFGLL